MTVVTRAGEKKAVCPDCGVKIAVKGEIVIGLEVVCPSCDAELEVVETEPLELDWIYEDEGWEDDEDQDWEDDDDDDEKEEESW